MADCIQDRMPNKSDSVEEEGVSKSTRNISKMDNAEATEDVSFKVVREAIPRASSGAGLDGQDRVVLVESAVTGSSLAHLPSELLDKTSVANNSVGSKIQKEVQFVSVDAVTEWDNNINVTESLKLCVVDGVLQEDAVGSSDNAVLRQLLRGPRYFDPPDISWGTCYKCGEEGHSAAKCKSAKRKKPCFVCGSLMHGARQCQKSRGCFNCKQSGHVAKDCPKKFKGLFQGCLKCGSHGHDMFSCTNDYSSDDLKEIQCYICKEVGHLCCANYICSVSTVVSCYKCGQLDHTGLACSRSDGETAADRTPISCFKCGEEGHFSRACKSTAKGKKRKRNWTSPKKKGSKEGKVYKGYKSTPQARRNGLDLDGNLEITSSKRKIRGGWIMDDPEDMSAGETSQYRGWKSPSKSSAEKNRTPNWSTKRPYGRSRSAVASRNSFEHGYTASRFGNPSAGGLSKEKQWW